MRVILVEKKNKKQCNLMWLCMYNGNVTLNNFL
jgi:hypothetical protein